MPDAPIKDDKVDEEVVLATPTQTPEPEVKEEPEAQAEPETPVDEPEAAPADEEPEQTPEEPRPSNRLLTRAQQIVNKYGTPEPRTSRPQPKDALDYSQALDADPEVIKQLQEDRQRAQDTSYNEGLKKAEAIEFKTNIRLDLPLVQEKMSKLDPRDAEVLDKEYLQTVGFDPQTGFVDNPNIGYAEFIEARIEMAERMGASMSTETAKNVAKQAAATGLRPDGSSAKRLNLNKSPEDMTMEELYAASGLPDTRPKK